MKEGPTEVERWDPAVDGPLDEAAMRRRLEARGFSVTRYDYPPGTRFPEHTHAEDKIDAVLEGRFELVIEGRRIVLEAGDMVFVGAGVRHSAAVVGEATVTSLDAVRRPPGR